MNNPGSRSLIINFLRGLMIGTADLFPGLSGGTVALIMGIYKRFITALSAFNKPLVFSIIKREKGREERIRALDIVFLLPLLAGIGSAIFLGAQGTSHLIENHPVLVMSFFFGFLLLSLKMPWRMVTRKGTRSYVALIIGIVAAVVVSLYEGDSVMSLNPTFLALSGFVALSFMLLPGVSGSSALVLMGSYAAIISAVGRLDFSILLPFVLGAGFGLIFITRILNKMLRDHHDVTMATLTGILAGSIVRVWPLRTEDGFAEGYPTIGIEMLSLEILFGVASGLAIIILTDRIAKKIERKREHEVSESSKSR